MGLAIGRPSYFCAVSALSGILILSESGSPTLASGPAYSWAGCYVGAEAGITSSKSNWAYTNSNAYTATGNTDPQLVAGANFYDNRGVIGLQGGCNRAASDRWIVGVEGSWITSPMNHDTNNNFIPFPQDPEFNFREILTTNIQSAFAITGRLGYSVSPNWLVYVKGGYAIGEIKTSGRVSPAFDPAIFNWTDTRWHGGWTAGAGVEYRLFNNVTIGAEYAYYRLGNADHSGVITAEDTVNGVTSPANPVNHRVNAEMQTVMARVNFAFGGGPYAASGPDAAYAAYLKAPPLPVRAGTFSAFTNSEVRYSSWNGTRGSNIFAADRGSGYQVYAPTTTGFNYEVPELKLESRFKGGYVYANHSTPNQLAIYNGPIDTQATFNATFLNFETIKPTLGVALNLPTGNSFLPGNERFARMDPDLVDVGSYGVGFNVNPTAGFVVGINESTALSLSAGYAWQGAFTKEAVELGVTPSNFLISIFDARQRVKPGDTFTANANLTSSVGKNLLLLASFAYMAESKLTIDGIPSGRAGGRYISNLTANYQIDERWALALNGSWSFQEKNEISNFLDGLVADPKNSNSHLLIGSFEPSYQLTDRLRLAVNYSVLYRNENFYNQLEDQFSPAKLKHTAGISATYAIAPNASIDLRGSHSWVRQNDGPLLVTTILPPPPAFALLPPTMTFEVWAASIGATMTF
jgi:opacity protein-like surface antigen